MKRIVLALPFLLLAACDNGLTDPSKSLVPNAPTMSASAGTCTLADGSIVSTGYNQYGYNYCAGIFNGTGSSWCLAGGQAANCMGVYSLDKLTMKWNAAWDSCNFYGTPAACAGAWTDNQWNGNVKNGSGAVWHYKIQWIGGNCGADYTPLADGGYCIWGSYETLMDQGHDPNIGPGHMWFAHAKPNGYGN